MSYVLDNWKEVGAVIGAVVTIISFVAALTKTKKDDTIVKWLKDATKRFLSLN